MQRALLQYRNPKKYDIVYAALVEAGREDLIGHGPKCLIKPREDRFRSQEYGHSQRSTTRGKAPAKGKGPNKGQASGKGQTPIKGQAPGKGQDAYKGQGTNKGPNQKRNEKVQGFKSAKGGSSYGKDRNGKPVQGVKNAVSRKTKRKSR